MEVVKRIGWVAAVLLGTQLVVQAQTHWHIDTQRTRIHFDGSGAEGTVNGLSGTIVFDEQQLASSYFSVEIDLNTLDTGNKLKTKHAKGDDWFHIDLFPKARFTSESIQKTPTGFEAKGVITLHGVSKKLTIPFQFADQVFTGNITLDRKDFGIEGPFLSFTVGDDFKVDVRVPVNSAL